MSLLYRDICSLFCDTVGYPLAFKICIYIQAYRKCLQWLCRIAQRKSPACCCFLNSTSSAKLLPPQGTPAAAELPSAPPRLSLQGPFLPSLPGTLTPYQPTANLLSLFLLFPFEETMPPVSDGHKFRLVHLSLQELPDTR